MRTLFLLIVLSVSARCQPGFSWGSSFADSSIQGEVLTNVVFDDGSGPAIYIGGSFVIPGPAPIFSLAKRVGNSWVAVGGGIVDAALSIPVVNALHVHNDGTSTDLYVGGNFDIAGGVSVRNLARFDGANWSDPGGFRSSVQSQLVRCIHTHNDGSGNRLYVGGDLWSIGVAFGQGVVRLGNNGWESIAGSVYSVGTINGNPIPVRVHALETWVTGGTALLCVGGLFNRAGTITANSIAAWDGATWSTFGLGATSGPSGTLPTVYSLRAYAPVAASELFAGGDFSTIGAQPIPGVARWNGTGWSPLTTGGIGGVSSLFTSPSVRAMVAHDSGSGVEFFVGGEFTSVGGTQAAGCARWNGTQWQTLGSGLGGDNFQSPRVSTLTSWSPGFSPTLWVGGAFRSAGGAVARNLATWSGGAWQVASNGPPGPGGLDSSFIAPRALATFRSSQGEGLFTAGFFSEAGNNLIPSLARWDGVNWSAVGGGVRSFGGNPVQLRTMVAHDDGNGSALYVGGGVFGVGSIAATYLARWNGTTWSTVGSGAPTDITALGVHDDGTGAKLYVGAGAGNVFRWDGQSWSLIGSVSNSFALPPTISAFATYDDGSGPALYVGGWFHGPSATLNSVPVSSIAKWNGSTWSSVGSGITMMPGTAIVGSPQVRSLVVWDSGSGPALYAGGMFDLAGGVVCNGLARWNGSQWSAVGSGVDHPGYPGSDGIHALRVFHEGTTTALYAAGVFTTAGGIPANGVARYDGTTWSSLGSGLARFNGTPDPRALAAYEDGNGLSLFVAGSFEMSGSTSAVGLAHWHSGRPRVSVTQFLGAGTSLFVSNSNLDIGGEYLNVFSFEPCALGPGRGPYWGLCAVDPILLFLQASQPVGAAPFHFTSVQSAVSFGPYAPPPPGTVIDTLCIAIVGASVGSVSGVTRVSVQ